jgi:hypothetical protein
MTITSAIVRSMIIGSRIALSTNMEGLVVVVVILVPLDINEVASIDFELLSVLKERHDEFLGAKRQAGEEGTGTG